MALCSKDLKRFPREPPEAALPLSTLSGSFPPQQPQQRRLLGTPVLRLALNRSALSRFAQDDTIKASTLDS